MAIGRRWLRRICGGGAFATIATLAACSGGAAAPIDGTGATGDAATGADGSGTGDDAATHSDGASTTDATTPLDGGDASTTGDGATQGCGAYANATSFTCAKDGGSRVKCVGGATLVTESCARGCLRKPTGQDDVCLGAADSDTLDCNGTYGTTPATDGDYYITSFGCWVDPNNTIHTDPGDNCIPSCLAKAKQAGLCMPGDTGPECEERVNWFTADGARFGCLARLKMTNPANGKSVIAVALDYGPACTVERSVNEEVLDASGRVDLYLFGGDRGATDRATVHVVEVDPSTPLGPVP